VWERGGRTLWAPALVHAAVDGFKLLEPIDAPGFALALAAIALFVPLLALAFGRRAPAHDDAELQELAPDALAAPTWILAGDRGDQRAYLGAQPRPAERTAGAPPPEQAPAAPVPGDDGLGPDHDRVAAPVVHVSLIRELVQAGRE
jgi:hypothetical protein